MPSPAATGRADPTDAQWATLEPLLPVGKTPGRPPLWSKRRLLDGIRRRVRVGSPWRDVPPVYGCWQTSKACPGAGRGRAGGRPQTRYEATVHIAAVNEWLRH
ncbi:transposase [Streptomyces sp. MN03-5084-2B]|nr:transposase [Streptomyces sp. MN03-5084-2B]